MSRGERRPDVFVAFSPDARSAGRGAPGHQRGDTIVLTGLVGAFTTFSTFAFETGQQLPDQLWLHAAANVTGQVVLGLFCLFLGFALGRWLEEIDGPARAGTRGRGRRQAVHSSSSSLGVLPAVVMLSWGVRAGRRM